MEVAQNAANKNKITPLKLRAVQRKKVETLGDPESVKGVPETLATSSSNVALLALARRNSGGERTAVRFHFDKKTKKGHASSTSLTSLSISVGTFENLSLESIRPSSLVVSVFISILNPLRSVALNQLVQVRPLFQIPIKL